MILVDFMYHVLYSLQALSQTNLVSVVVPLVLHMMSVKHCYLPLKINILSTGF